MKEKIAYWIVTAVLAILSALAIVFLVEDIFFSTGVLLYYILCLCMVVGVNFKLKPYEWMMFSLSMLCIILMLAYNLHLLYTLIPLTLAFIIMLIIRICKKEKFGRIVLMIVLEVLCGILVFAFGSLYKDAKIIENMPYKQEVVSEIYDTHKEFDLIKFEDSDELFNIHNDQTKLLRNGDTVSVKIFNGIVHSIKR